MINTIIKKQTQIKIKQSAESVSSSTLQDDNELYMTLKKGLYEVEFHLFLRETVTTEQADFAMKIVMEEGKYIFYNGSALYTQYKSYAYSSIVDSLYYSSETNALYLQAVDQANNMCSGDASTGNSMPCIIKFLVEITSESLIKLQWGQNSTVVDSQNTICADSYMKTTKLN